MRVSLRARGETVASEEIAGQLLILPTGMRVATRSGSEVVLELAKSGSEAPDLLVGEVPLVYGNPGSGSAEVAFVKVQPPSPFTAEDVEAMWDGLLETTLRTFSSSPGQGRREGPSPVFGDWLRPEAVPRAAGACRQLLTQWPSRESVTTIWTPPDIGGAPEDLVETDRRGGSKPGKLVGGVRVPDRVARRHRSSGPWTSARLSAACHSLATAVERQLASGAGSADLVRPIRIVGERASAPSTVDPPTSSWPTSAKTTLMAVISARIALALGTERRDRVPLSRVWQLYESWLAIAVVEALHPLLGRGQETRNGSSWCWEWALDSRLVRVHPQATIGAKANGALAGHPDGLVSVLSDLVPDVLVTVCDPEGEQRALCVEAKRRTAKTEMIASEVAEAAAKYVWGIRSGADLDTPIASVILASSANLAGMHDVPRGRVSSCFVLPTQGREAFGKLVRQRVEALLAAVGAG